MSDVSPGPGAGRPRRWLRALGPAAIVAAVLTITVVLTVQHPSVLVTLLPSTDMREMHADFDTFWHSAVALVRGDDIYATSAKLTNLNPPILSVLLAPFATLSSLSAYRLFAVLTLLMVVGAVFAVARELRVGRAWTAVAVVAVLLSSPLHGTLFLGQIYGLLLVALAAGWIAERRGRPVLAAALYGIAVALKPSLAPLLLLPLVQRRWASLRAGIAGAAVATMLGVAVAGVSSGPEWLRIGLAEPVPDVLDNAALPGVAIRFGLPSAVGTVAGVVLLVATLVWIAMRDRRGGVDPAGTAPWAVVAAGLLMAPIAWHNYLLLLWPGVVILVAQGRRATAAVLFALPLIPVSWGAWWTDGDSWSPLGRSLYCAILLTYWFVLLRAATVGSPADQRVVTDVVVPAGRPVPTERTAS